MYAVNWMKNLKAGHSQHSSQTRMSGWHWTGLTVFPNHTAGPRAVVIHSQHAAVKLAAVVGPIRFPITAFRTPFRTAIVLADEDVLGVKLLQTRRVGVRIGPRVVGLALEVIALPGSAGSLGLLALPSFEGQWAEGDQAGVDVYNDDQA